jgi:phosphonate transport system substrate-binding protein
MKEKLIKLVQFLNSGAHILTILFLFNFTLFANENYDIKFGVTGVALKEDITTLYYFRDYLSKKSGLNIHLKITRSYEEMQALIKSKNVDFAYICGATYVELLKLHNAKLLVVPNINGKNQYYSYIIAKKRSGYINLQSFKDKLFAFSDPESNSGAIAPSYALLKAGYNVENFFKEVIYTYDHGESIHAVLDGFVQGAAVDSLVYKSFAKTHPKKIKKLRVVQKFGPFPAPPIIIRPTLSKKIAQKLKYVLLHMQEDVQGRYILRSLSLSKFANPKNSSYKIIADMIDAVKGY